MAARSTANRSAADMISTPLSCAATRRSAGRHGYVSTILVAVSLCLPAADVTAGDHGVAPRLEAAMAEKGFADDAWSVIDNLLHHGKHDRPIAVDPDVLDLLRQPARIAEGAGSFAASLHRRVGIEASTWRSLLSNRRRLGGASSCPAAAPRLSPIVDWYVDRLNVAAGHLKAARQSCDAAVCDDMSAFVAGMTDDAVFRRLFAEPSVLAAAQKVKDAAPSIVALHADLLACLRRLPAGTLFNATPEYRTTSWGGLVVGSGGDDVYRPGDAAVILDLGGDDRYQLAPLPPGGLRVIIDLGGNDFYDGSDAAVLSVSVLIDTAGNDNYVSPGAGQGATLGGLSLLVDGDGDDAYKAASFGQGAAALGFGILIDGGGEDRYRVGSYGQGYGGPRGIGVLWNLDGNDTYTAAGTSETRDGRGRPSFAQGAGRGIRRGLGGGAGLLLDDAGDDTYDADLFAQGSGYYFAFGMLRDDTGHDRYHARRYAQGAGTHAAVGVLRDRAGDDVYTADVGVSQGMGLDASVGLLRDDQGDDRYDAGSLAQGAGTANGIGIVVDGGGADQFVLGWSGWGQDHWSRGLPGPAFLLGAEAIDSFVLKGRNRAFDSIPEAGPHTSLPPRNSGSDRHTCPVVPSRSAADRFAPTGDSLPLIRKSAPVFGSGDGAIATYRTLAASLPLALPRYLAAVPKFDFAARFSLLEVVRCWISTADAVAKIEIRRILVGALTATERHPGSWLIGRLLGFVPGSLADRRQAIERLYDHPSCAVRSRAVDLVRTAWMEPDPLPPWARRLVPDAMAGDCWQLRAAVLRLIDEHPSLSGDVDRTETRMPKFLRRPRPMGVQLPSD
jgi:hypothetical protein